MDKQADYHKVIIACNRNGVVQELHLDTYRLLDGISLPVSVHSLFSQDSLKDFGRFWISVINNKLAENIVLELACNGMQQAYLFSGYLLEDTVLLTGSTEFTISTRAMEELMTITNEQTNKIRLSEKELFNLRTEANKPAMDGALLDDFSTINNELINNKRALMRKNREIELLNQELEVLNDNLRNLTYSVSHDLREPLRMVSSFIGLLEKRYQSSLDDRGKTYLKFASEGSERLGMMFNALLEFHKSGNIGDDEIVDLDSVLTDVRKVLKLSIEERKAEINSSRLPVVKGSYTAYLQVFQNLISNSIKFTPEERVPVVNIRTEIVEGQLTLIIEDNGVGIPETQYDDVFMLFKRLDVSQNQSGTGVGLAMVKRNIEQMKGKIWLSSRVGKGTSFYITLNDSGC